MIQTCPACGSTEIIPDLNVLTWTKDHGRNPIFTVLYEPAPEKHPFLWAPEMVSANFRAAICGSCGHAQIYATNVPALLQAYKSGWTSVEPT
ncbi:MAG: hypothetical protein JXA25_11935 [Anaerolineales bacterium]|nr:hypothetical protein [Anaerolineales bacterium]